MCLNYVFGRSFYMGLFYYCMSSEHKHRPHFFWTIFLQDVCRANNLGRETCLPSEQRASLYTVYSILKIRSPYRARVRQICLQSCLKDWGPSALTQPPSTYSIHLGCWGLSPWDSERWGKPVQTWNSCYLLCLCVTNSQKSCAFCPYAGTCGRLNV